LSKYDLNLKGNILIGSGIAFAGVFHHEIADSSSITKNISGDLIQQNTMVFLQ